MLFDEQFEGFDAAAFRAFEEAKWASNVYNMERLAVSEQLKAMGRMLEGPLSASYRFHWEVTPHMPSVFNGKRVSELVLYFTRNQEEQRSIVPLLDRRISLPDQISDAGEHHRHATLGVRIHSEACDVGLMLHSTAWLDVMNLLNRCHVPFERATFVERVRALPEQMTVRISNDEEVKASDFSGSLLDRLEEGVLNQVFVILIGVRFAAGVPEAGNRKFAEVCRNLLEALLPVWEFVAWKPTSDYLEVAEESRRIRSAAESGTADLEVGTKVRVTSGLFSGREGVVTEMDHKGLVRVLVGKVSVRTDGRSVQLL